MIYLLLNVLDLRYVFIKSTKENFRFVYQILSKERKSIKKYFDEQNSIRKKISLKKIIDKKKFKFR